LGVFKDFFLTNPKKREFGPPTFLGLNLLVALKGCQHPGLSTRGPIACVCGLLKTFGFFRQKLGAFFPPGNLFNTGFVFLAPPTFFSGALLGTPPGVLWKTHRVCFEHGPFKEVSGKLAAL